MSIYDKISNAQETTWLTDGIAEAEAKSIIELAKISAKIERRRLELNMTQKEFATYMNVYTISFPNAPNPNAHFCPVLSFIEIPPKKSAIPASGIK